MVTCNFFLHKPMNCPLYLAFTQLHLQWKNILPSKNYNHNLQNTIHHETSICLKGPRFDMYSKYFNKPKNIEFYQNHNYFPYDN
jgi:hypothetical protein